MRMDIMSKMRGVAAFATLWKRRTSIVLLDGMECELLSLPDLVQAKKTQRDKDWPMIRRLVEAHYFERFHKPNSAQVRFWLSELRTPQLLVETARRFRVQAERLAAVRPLLADADLAKIEDLEKALLTEELAERTEDRRYWAPLRIELERLRHGK